MISKKSHRRQAELTNANSLVNPGYKGSRFRVMLHSIIATYPSVQVSTMPCVIVFPL